MMRRDDGECRMSDLPNDILISIISMLTLREATATSILSRRWRYLHTYMTRLDFPRFTLPRPIDRSEGAVEKRFRDHVKMINGVMDSHRGGRGVKEVKMHMYSIEGANVKKWVEFALTKDIETMDIGMHVVPSDCPARSTLRARYSLGLSRISSEYLYGAKSLKQLSLGGVEMDEQDLEVLVSNFVNLETLSMTHGARMKRISIAEHPRLRHVYINGGREVEAIEIRDVVNLVTLGLHYLSDICVVELHDVPNLTQLHTGDYGALSSPYIFSRIQSSICRQLQLLHVSSPDFCHRGRGHKPDYGFVNTKHLVLEVTRMSELVPPGFYTLYHLIRTCPSLEKLKIKFVWWEYDLPKKFGMRKAVVDDDEYHPWLTNLKELELDGYGGCDLEFKLASNIIQHAQNLERLIVVACDVTPKLRKKSIARARRDFQGIRPQALGLHII